MGNVIKRKKVLNLAFFVLGRIRIEMKRIRNTGLKCIRFHTLGTLVPPQEKPSK